MESGVNAAALTFGDGAHRCPGQPLALWETDALLSRLLSLRPEVAQAPTLTWVQLIEGYQLRGLQLSFPAGSRVDEVGSGGTGIA